MFSALHQLVIDRLWALTRGRESGAKPGHVQVTSSSGGVQRRPSFPRRSSLWELADVDGPRPPGLGWASPRATGRALDPISLLLPQGPHRRGPRGERVPVTWGPTAMALPLLAAGQRPLCAAGPFRVESALGQLCTSTPQNRKEAADPGRRPLLPATGPTVPHSVGAAGGRGSGWERAITVAHGLVPRERPPQAPAPRAQAGLARSSSRARADGAAQGPRRVGA